MSKGPQPWGGDRYNGITTSTGCGLIWGHRGASTRVSELTSHASSSEYSAMALREGGQVASYVG